MKKTITIIDKKNLNSEVLYRLKDLPIKKGIFWYCDIDKSYFPLSKILSQVLESGDMGSIIKLASSYNINELNAAYKKIKQDFYKKNEIGYIALTELLEMIIDVKKEKEAESKTEINPE
ncbi:MAG: hypothetical protein M1276_05450 [Deltaproteobacteria bacterium]|nr:hypothetical protein [Deltaproteobacteria bacterium]